MRISEVSAIPERSLLGDGSAIHELLPGFCGAVPPAAAAAAAGSSLASFTRRKKSSISSFPGTSAPQDLVADAHTLRMCSKTFWTRIRVPGAQHRAVTACQTKEMSGFQDEDVFCSTWTLQGCSKLFRTAVP